MRARGRAGRARRAAAAGARRGGRPARRPQVPGAAVRGLRPQPHVPAVRAHGRRVRRHVAPLHAGSRRAAAHRPDGRRGAAALPRQGHRRALREPRPIKRSSPPARTPSTASLPRSNARRWRWATRSRPASAAASAASARLAWPPTRAHRPPSRAASRSRRGRPWRRWASTCWPPPPRPACRSRCRPATIRSGPACCCWTDPRKEPLERRHRHHRRPRAQPQERLAHAAARPLHRDHGSLGLGQVVAGLRHHLRRRPAPLRRVAVGLCPAVPRPDGQARRRQHRRPVAGDLDRPAHHLAQPALHGGHRHRDLRLPAAALRARRPSALSQLRTADRRPVARADHRPGARARGRHQVQRQRPRRARPQGRVRAALPRAARRRLHPCRRRRRGAHARRRDRARQEVQARHLGDRRPAGHERRPAPPPDRLRRDGGSPVRRARRHRARRRSHADVLREVRLPALRHLHARDPAAYLLVQQPSRRLPRLSRARLHAGDRPRSRGARPRALHQPGRPAAVRPGDGLDGGDLPGRHRALPRRPRRPVARAAGRAARPVPHGHARPHRHALPQLPGALAALQGPVPRHPRQPAAALRRDRIRPHPSEDRGVHERAPVRGVPRRPSQADQPRGHGRRAQHLTSSPS